MSALVSTVWTLISTAFTGKGDTDDPDKDFLIGIIH